MRVVFAYLQQPHVLLLKCGDKEAVVPELVVVWVLVLAAKEAIMHG
jgi:hypothetical protein